jgi:acetyl esterase/lipase
MGLVENVIIKATKVKMKNAFNSGEVEEISSEGLREYKDIPYQNHDGKELLMDIFEPIVEKGTELPVIVNIHGGGLIGGSKNLSVGFCRQLAKRGYLVFSLEYRLIPEVRVYEQFDDVCAGMDCVGKKLVDFDVDLTRTYITAESAGAYLATYVAAMKYSEVLQNAVGYKSTNMTFRAMGLISGMFYTTRNDMLGRFLSGSIYGKDDRSKAIAEYTNPEHPEIIHNIPPCYLITSKADMLERYTLDFAGELGNKGVVHYLRHMGSDPKLLHAFPVLNPALPESERVIDEIVAWFVRHEPLA